MREELASQQAALKQSEERYRNLIEQSPAAVLVHSEGIIRYANPASATMFGASSSEILVGMPLLSFVAPQSRGFVVERLAELKDRGRVGAAEETLLRLDGSEFVGEAMASMIVFEGRPAVQVIAHDVSERKARDEELRLKQELFTRAFHYAFIGSVLCEPDGTIVDVNERFCDLVGIPRDELMGSNISITAGEDERDFLRERLDSIRRGEIDSYEIDRQLVRRDGTKIWVRVRASVILAEDGSPWRLVAHIDDVSDARQREEDLRRRTELLDQEVTLQKLTAEQLREMTMVDELTGLRNRRGFMTLCRDEIEEAEGGDHALTFLFIDVNQMKAINDVHGHDAGDRALMAVASSLRATFRSADIIGRIGGDEFGVLMRVREARGIDNAVARLKERIAAVAKNDERFRGLSIAVGVALFDPRQPVSVQELMAAADSAMYEDKRALRRSP